MGKQETIFVTGGASGIGLAIVEAAVARGWRAIVADFDQRNLDRAREVLAQAGEALRFEKVDIADETNVIRSVSACEAEFGPITGLVNSAGIGKAVIAMETTTDLFRRTLEVNLIGTFVVSREIARHMQVRKAGAIVNIASVSGIRGNYSRLAYGTSKGGMITMTKIMAVELATDGIRINAIAPGPIDTPMARDMHSAHTRKEWTSAVPQARYGTPAEIAGAALFLLDNAQSSYITGQTICVDGGFTSAGLIHSPDGSAA